MATYFRDTFTVGAAKLIEAHTTAEASGDVPDGIAWLWMAGAGDGTGKQLRVIPASDGYDSRLRFGSLVDGIAPALGSHMVVYPNLAIPVKNYKVHARHVHFQDPAATVSIMPVARLDPATGQRYAMVYLPQSNSAQVRRYTTPTSNSQPATATGIAVTPVTTSDCSLRVNEGQVTFAISVNGGAAQSVTYTDPSPLNNVINTFAGLQVYTESGNSGTPNTQLLQVLEFAVTDVDDPAPWTVVPTITLSSDTINPTFAEGGAAPSVPNISITTPIGVLNGLSIAKVGVAAWLTVGLTATTAPAQATFVIDPTGLVEGTYDAVVRITSTALGVTNSPQDIDVHLTVTAAPAPAIGVRDDDDNAVNIVTLSTETGGSLAPLEFNGPDRTRRRDGRRRRAVARRGTRRRRGADRPAARPERRRARAGLVRGSGQRDLDGAQRHEQPAQRDGHRDHRHGDSVAQTHHVRRAAREREAVRLPAGLGRLAGRGGREGGRGQRGGRGLAGDDHPDRHGEESGHGGSGGRDPADHRPAQAEHVTGVRRVTGILHFDGAGCRFRVGGGTLAR
jgi:hypothetical protein